MDATVKAKWIAALRSGNFVQGKEYLHIGNKYCCLGVLQKIEGLESEGEGLQLLADTACDKIGLELNDQDQLAEMNDNGQSFETIAEYIEQNL
jgi:hypothetical protein